ncbi:MAG: hypothetical protein ACXWUD_09695 [Methylosarcina sp.]
MKANKDKLVKAVIIAVISLMAMLVSRSAGANGHADREGDSPMTVPCSSTFMNL